MQVETIETERLCLRGFQKEDAVFAISIWNDPEMGEYLPDETMDEIDEAYLKEIEQLSEDVVSAGWKSPFQGGKKSPIPGG